jgi:glycosyltransferase involved in cell wall biosynthesis
MTVARPGDLSGRSGLRVLHVAEAVRGGVATYLRTLVQAQRDDPALQVVRVLVPARHLGELEPIAPHVVAVPPAGGRLATAFALARRARQLCRDDAVDLVHLHSTFAGLAGRLLRPKAHALIYCPHGWAFDREGSGAMRAAVRVTEAALAPRCDAIVAISRHEFDAARAAGIPAKRLRLVHNGIGPAGPAEHGDPWPTGDAAALRLLFVGRFDRQKGFDVFVDMARALPQAQCVAIGDYSIDAPTRLQLPANVHAPGWQSHAAVERWMQHADALVMPSRWEGFGLTAVEAMRAGLAVIASRVGGLQEIVADGATGWLVPAANAGAIVDRLRGASVAAVQSELRALGAAGRARFEAHFTAARMHGELLALYRDCLARRRSVDRPATAPQALPVSRR